MRDRMDMVSGSLGDKVIRYAIPLAALVVSNLISSAILFAVLAKTELIVRIAPRKLRVHGDVLGQIRLPRICSALCRRACPAI